jgi:hypothetical protein
MIHERINRDFFSVFSVVFILVCYPPAIAFALPKLAVDMPISTAGYYRLNWTAEEANSDHVFVLQGATNAEFENPETIYQGPDLATVISGKSNGKYYYRVGIAPPDEPAVGKWSEVVSVDVKHHGLTKAVGFFLAGLMVFLATLIVIVKGAKKDGD